MIGVCEGVIKMFFEYKKSIELLYILSFFVFAIGSVIGSVYYVHSYKNSLDIQNYFNNYIASLKAGMSFYDISVSSVKSYLGLSLIIIVTSFFKFGYLIPFIFFIRKGFINAFTAAAMIGSYGIKGLFLIVSFLPQILISIPLVAFMMSICRVYIQNRREFEKKFRIIYIIILIIFFTIFCISAVLEGLIATTFMKWLALKVT